MKRMNTTRRALILIAAAMIAGTLLVGGEAATSQAATAQAAPAGQPAAPAQASTAPGPRYLDTAPARSDAVRLLILDPAEEGINAILGLRKQGFLAIDNLIVVGLYHARERANYLAAQELVRAGNLDWIKFHELTGDIDRTRLFLRNSLTADFEAAVAKTDGVVFFGGYQFPYLFDGKEVIGQPGFHFPWGAYVPLGEWWVFGIRMTYGDSSWGPGFELAPGIVLPGWTIGSRSLYQPWDLRIISLHPDRVPEFWAVPSPIRWRPSERCTVPQSKPACAPSERWNASIDKEQIPPG